MLFLEINKTLRLLRKLQNLLPRSALIIMYKAFVIAHLGYGDILHDQAYIYVLSPKSGIYSV